MANNRVTAYGTPNGIYVFVRNADGSYETGRLIDCVRKVTYKLVSAKTELPGDNGICDTTSRKKSAEIALEYGGELIDIHALLSGGTLEESVSPVYTRVDDKTTDQPPEFGVRFLVEGSHSGGFGVTLYRVTFAESGPGESAQEAYTMSNAAGTAYGAGDDGVTIRSFFAFEDLEDGEINTTWASNP